MKRKLMAFCTVIVAVSVVFTVSGADLLKSKTGQDVSYAQRSQYYNEADDMNTTMKEVADMNSTTGITNPVDGFVDGKLEGFSSAGDVIGGLLGGDGGLLGSGGGIGDAIGGIGDVIGGIFGGNSNESTPANNNVVTYPVNDNPGSYIDPVPAATYDSAQNEVSTPTPSASSSTSIGGVSSSVSQGVSHNNNVTNNPYQKPVGTINPGDSGEGVKWMQWIFYYTGYGLDEKDITGEYDEKTQKLVEKLQKDKGLTVDGVVNDAVIDKIELLYYEHMVTDTTAVSGVITLPNTIPVTGDGATTEKDDSFGLVVAIVAAIWCVAIIAILVVYILKKKKKAKKNEENTQEQAPEEGEKQDSGVRSLSDLFEEANK